MKIKSVFFLVGILLVFSSGVMLISSKGSGIKLVEGKNVVLLNITSPFYVETLVKLNPKIEAVSYSEGNVTIGYVNVFKGIGENFVVENREYEIVVSKNISLVLP